MFTVEIEPGGPAGAIGDVVRGRPVRGTCTVSSAYGEPRNNGVGYHTGLDLAPIFPWTDSDREWRNVAGGVLEWVGLAARGAAGRSANGGYGRVVQIAHDDGRRTRGAHLREFSPRIQAWIDGGFDPRTRPYLEADELVGIVGNTGAVEPAPLSAFDDVRGVHLHFECIPPGGGFVDPVEWMIDVDSIVVEPEQTSIWPTPGESELPPLELGPVAALNEARLLYRLVLDLDAHPIDFDDAAAAIHREALELVAAFGERPATLEARMLAGTIDVLRINPQVGYSNLLDVARREVAEIIAALQSEVPA